MGKLKTLKIKGIPKDRGIAHGEHFRSEIHDHMNLWKETAENELKMPIDVYLKKLYKDTDFLPAIKKYAPDILEEVEGIAVGSGLPFDWALARQLSDEEPWYRNTIKYGLPLNQHCTTVGVKTDKGNIIGQNMDTPKYYDGSQVVLEIEEENSDLAYKIMTITGKVSLCGMNNFGVGITCNSVIQLNFNPSGLPEDFVVRKALQKKSFKAMQEFLNEIPHASGQNYLYGGPDGAQSLECSAGAKINSMPQKDSEIMYHTNHHVCNNDSSVWDMAMQMLKSKDKNFYDNLQMRLQKDTYRRYEVVKKLMSDIKNKNVQGLMEVLKDRTSPLSIETDDMFSNFTLSSNIMVLDKDKPEMYVSCGPAHLNDYQKFVFNNN